MKLIAHSFVFFCLSWAISLTANAQQWKSGTCAMNIGTNLYSVNSVTTAGATSRTATIYQASQGYACLAGTALTTLYMNRFAGTAALTGSPNLKIYLKETTAIDYGAAALDWATEIATATLVYDGNPSAIIGTTTGLKGFPLIAPFNATSGNNLAVLWEYSNAAASTGNATWEYEYNAPCVITTNSNTTKYINTTTGILGTSLSVTNFRRPLIGFDYTGAAAPMIYSSSTTLQSSTGTTKAGSVNQLIVRADITTNCTGAPINVSSINFNTNGSTAAAADIAKARVYYTTTTIFAATTQFGADVLAPNGAFTVTGSQLLQGGVNYFWLVYDLNCNATAANLLDGECTSVNVGGTPYTPTITAPTGTRAISGSSTATQSSTAATSAGAVNAQIIRVPVDAPMSCTSLTDALTQLNFATTGTTLTSDISNARVFYTGTSTIFSTATQFGTDVVAPNGAFAVVGSQALVAGINYFWLVYDIACAIGATTDVVDAEVTGFTVGTYTNTYTGTTGTPTGTRTISTATVSSYDTKADGNWSNPNVWACGVPPVGTTLPININHNVGLDINFDFLGNLNVAGGKIFTLNPTTVFTMGATGGSNKIMTVNGTLTNSGATLNVNGALSFPLNSTFNMTSGTINLDPNDGTSAGSTTVTSTLNILTSNLSGVTGGAINILDPMFTTSTTYRSINYSHATLDAVLGTNCVVTLGGGTHTNPLNTYGFFVESNSATGTLEIGNLVVNGGRFSTQRHMSTYPTSTSFMTKVRNLTVNAGAEVVQNSGGAILAITGDLVNNGFVTIQNISIASGLAIVGDAQYSGGVILSNNTLSGQSITGTGFFKKLVADPDPTTQADNKVSGLQVWSNAAFGVTLGMPLNATATLRLNDGRINTTATNLLTLGESTALLGTLYTTANTAPAVAITPYAGGWVFGPFKRWFSNAITPVGQAGYIPVGSATRQQVADVHFTAAPSAGGTLTSEFIGSTLGQTGFPQTSGGYAVKAVSPTGYWQIDNTNGLVPDVYTATFDATTFTKNVAALTAIGSADLPEIRVIKRSNTPMTWADGSFLAGTVAPINLNACVIQDNTFFRFAIGGGGLTNGGVLDIELKLFVGIEEGESNLIKWETIYENNLNVFVVEKSADGKEWRVLGETKPNASKVYALTDLKPYNTTFYRLRSIDHDGSQQLSTVILVTRKSGKFAINYLSPNPSTDYATLKFDVNNDAQIRLTLSNVLGQELISRYISAVRGNNTIEIDVTNLPKGVYTLSLNNGISVATQRLVKQ